MSCLLLKLIYECDFQILIRCCADKYTTTQIGEQSIHKLNTTSRISSKFEFILLKRNGLVSCTTQNNRIITERHTV